MSNFSSKTKYVEARPRREKKLGRGGSVVSGATSDGGSGVSKSYVDSNFVTLATEQTIPGAKDFVGGIKVNGMPLTYNSKLGVWEFTGDLFVTGNFAWGSSIDGFKPSTVMDAVRVDGSTIIKKKDSNGDWYLYAPGGGSGGTGGGLTATEIILLIENALKPYALATSIPTDNKQLLNGAGYATISDISSALAGYATERWVTDNYLANTGGIINGNEYVPLTIRNTNLTEVWVGFEDSVGTSYIGSSHGVPSIYLGSGSNNTILHSGNYSDYALPITGGTVNGNVKAKYFGFNSYQSGNMLGYLIPSEYELNTLYYSNRDGYYNVVILDSIIADFALPITGGTVNGDVTLSRLYTTEGVVLTNTGDSYSGLIPNSRITSGGQDKDFWLYNSNGAINHYATSYAFNHGDALFQGSISAASFIGSLTGNADSATKLATPRTIWGRSFDGTSDISGALSQVSWINFSNTDWGIYSGPTFGSHLSVNDIVVYGEFIGLTGNVAVGGTAADASLHVHGTTILGGDTTINGNLLVNGNVSWFSHSQRSLKNIISEQGLSLAQLERIKPIKFYWKDGRDIALHVGGVADVFAEVLPEVVALNLQDILCLNYVDAAFYVGASLIAPVLDHERRIIKGEVEQEAQKKETAKLKRELEEVKSKLNQLVA